MDQDVTLQSMQRAVAQAAQQQTADVTVLVVEAFGDEDTHEFIDKFLENSTDGLNTAKTEHIGQMKDDIKPKVEKLEPHVGGLMDGSSWQKTASKSKTWKAWLTHAKETIVEQGVAAGLKKDLEPLTKAALDDSVYNFD